MQILIIGNSTKARKLSDDLAKNKENIVFSNADNLENATYINLHTNSIKEIEDFIVANEVGFCILIKCEEDFDTEEFLNRVECPVLDCRSVLGNITSSLSSIKKFIYKNKIKTPKFGVFEKSLQALDFVQAAKAPVIITPDANYEEQGSYISETKDKAKDRIEKLFEKGNKKILLQEYIEGIEYTKYLISDGFSVINLFDTISYFDDFSTNDTKYVKEDKKKEIENEIMPVFLDNLMEDGIEFQGILGLNFIISTRGEIFLDKITTFTNELDYEILTNSLKTDFKELLYASASENIGEIDIEFNSKYVISADINGKIETASANTLNKAIEIIEFEGMDKKLLEEGFKFWKR